jgi:hypothetical protein
MKNLLGLVLVGSFAFSGLANAALHDRGNGMIYDSDQDITWLQDANYAMTSGHDDDGRLNWTQVTRNYQFYAWAVLSGDVTPVPLPSALILFGSGIIGIGITRIRRKTKINH